MKRILVVGGSNGIGLCIAKILASRQQTEKVYVVDKAVIKEEHLEEKIKFVQFDLTSDDYSIFESFADIDALIITAGFGTLELFKDVKEELIPLYFQVNTVAPIRIIKHFYDKLLSRSDFFCGIMVSISGFISSPFFAVYGATKAALKLFIESVNVELEKSGTTNRILNVSPGSIKGTSFNQGETDLGIITPLAIEILTHIERKDDLFIPQYEEIFKDVLERYHQDFRKEGLHSYEYKLKSERIKSK